MSTYQDDGTVASKALQIAASKNGSPYVWGAAGPNSFDCSGFVHYCYAIAGLPGCGNPTSHLWTTATIRFMGTSISYGQEQPGDLIMPDEGHVGICAGGNKYWDAPHTGTTVQLQSYGSPFAIRRMTTPSNGSAGLSGTTTLASSTDNGILSIFSGITQNVNWILQPHNWFRLVEILAGGILIVMALDKLIARATP